MTGFRSFIQLLVAISVVIAAVSNYLIINKLWKRRTKKDVAESISLGAALLGLGTGVPFFIQFTLFDHAPLPAAKQAIGIITGVTFVFIGSGLWVADNRGTSFFKLFVRALRLERKESGDLIKAMIQPRGAPLILRILEQMAAIDRTVDEREVALIREFAERWKLEAPELEAGAVGGDGSLFAVRQRMQDYLALDPPPEQAAELMDLLRYFAKVDANVAEEEELVLEELDGLLAAYLTDDAAAPVTFEVVIVPQNDDQVDAVRSLIPGAQLKQARGGNVFSVGHFYSGRYAELVCQRYIALGLFTTQVTMERRAAA